MNRRAAIIVAAGSLLLFVFMVLVFAASVPRASTDPPKYALSDSDLQNLGVTNLRDLVALRLSRGDLLRSTTIAIGALVWLPFLMGCATFWILILLYKHLGLDILVPGAVVVAGVVVIGWPGWITFGYLVVVVGIALPLLGAAFASRRDAASWRLGIHVAAATFLFFTTIVTSVTTHVVLTSYGGFRPASQVDPKELRAIFATLTHKTVPPTVKDATSWRVSQIPSLNTPKDPLTVFAANRMSAISFIVAAVFYLVVVWVIIIPAEKLPAAGENVDDDSDSDTQTVTFLRSIVRPRSERSGAEIAHWARVLFAIPFYLSVGVGFAVVYFNIYISAAAKQNVMLLYADFMQMKVEKYNQLVAAQQSFGPTESLVRRMLDAARDPGAPDTSATLYAARARYWPSAVIGQELPRVNPDIPSETRMALDPELTFVDMLYFSFVSFTTTGYGDIRPISDELRFWTVCENIIEVLFTAMFFVIAIERR